MIDDLLAHPAVQAAAAPFLLALVIAAALHRTRLLGLAVSAAFALVIALTIGYSFEALTATHKMIAAGLGSAVLLVLFEVPALPNSLRLRVAVAGVAALASVWMVSRVLQQQQDFRMALWGLATAAYTVLLVSSGLRVGVTPVQSMVASLMLGLAGAALAFLGASLLLAQFGIAVAAGAGAALLVQMVAGSGAPLGWTAGLPALMAAAGIGLLSVFTGTLPWYCLVPMLAIPWATQQVRADDRPVWKISLLTAAAAAVPVLITVAVGWFAVTAA